VTCSSELVQSVRISTILDLPLSSNVARRVCEPSCGLFFLFRYGEVHSPHSCSAVFPSDEGFSLLGRLPLSSMQRDRFTPFCRLPLLLCNEDGLSLLVRLLLPFLAARDSPLLICLLLSNHVTRRAYLSSLIFCYLQQRGFYPSESLLVVNASFSLYIVSTGIIRYPNFRLSPPAGWGPGPWAAPDGQKKGAGPSGPLRRANSDDFQGHPAWPWTSRARSSRPSGSDAHQLM